MKLLTLLCRQPAVRKWRVLSSVFVAGFILFSTTVLAQRGNSKTITGTVSSEKGDVLIGVSVKVKGTAIGASTDVNGKYSVVVPGDESTLVFSYLGYTTYEEAVKDRAVINVKLAEDANTLGEVVIVGYGTQSKKVFSGSAATVNMADLPKAANTSVNALLQGRAPGVTVDLSSAQPGGRYNISIRGRGAPLYVVDGVPLFNNNSSEPSINSFSNSAEVGFGGGINRDPLNALNPDDIESLTILKDASTASLYGVAASNGVVLITTKKGKADGKVTTDFRTSTTLQTPKKYFDFLNGKEFMQQSNRLARDQWLYNNNQAPYGTAAPPTAAFVAPYSQTEVDAAGVGTDWLDLMVRDGLTTEHNLSLSGGTPKTKIYTSVNYQGIKGAVQNSDTKIYRGRVNLEQAITEQLRMSVDLTLSQSNSQNASTGGGGAVEKYNSLQAAYAFSPAVGVYDADGNFSKSSNTLLTNPAAFLIIDDNSRNGRFFAAPKLKYTPLKNLVINVTGAIDKNSTNRRFYLPKKSRNSQFPEGMAQLSTSTNHNYNTESFATYTHKVGEHSFDLLGGAGYYKSFSEGLSMQAADFFTDAFEYNNISVASNKDKSFMSSSRSIDQKKISFWGRLTWNYKNRYSITASARRDGASNFAENKKWGTFPSISGSWNISDESFFASVKQVSNLKLRASYASTGNPGNLTPDALLSASGGRYLIGTTYYTAVSQSQLANPNLSWETYWEKNIGLDFGLFNERITGSIDVYQRDRHDILRAVPLPVNNSITSLNSNEGGKTRDEGYEIGLNTTNIKMKSFGWETGFNVSHSQGRTLERSPYDSPLRAWQHLDDLNGTSYGWKSMGILTDMANKPAWMPNARLGNVLYQDINGDSKLDDNDIVYLGMANPKWRFGFQNRFNYKAFDLSVDMYGSTKEWRANNFNTYSAVNRLIADRLNVTTNISEIWSSDNPTGTRPGLAANAYQGTAGSDFQVENVSFLRLRNVTLGYTFHPRKLVRNARVFVDLQNVALWTNYKGFDPEIGEANPYPQTLQTTFSLQIGF